MKKIRPERKHWWVGLGGTFDHFHKGHEHFLKFAAKQGENVLIGITAQHLTKKKSFSHTIEPFRVRAKNVANWCKKHEVNHEIVQLFDLYGPTLEDKRIQALAVTEETVSGADTINQARVAANMRELPVYICPMFKNSVGKSLHADQIRAGTVNRNGTHYVDSLKVIADTPISNTQRAFLKQPLGNMLPGIESITYRVDRNLTIGGNDSSATFTTVVGDRSTLLFIENNQPFRVAIVDGLIERSAISSNEKQTLENFISKHNIQPITAQNQAGLISTTALETVITMSNKIMQKTVRPQIIAIIGEEDLLTTVAILSTPLDSYVYYGQRNQGLVEVHVTEQLKEKIFRVLMER